VIAVHLIPLATDHALLVVVTESGRVMQEQIHMEALPDPRTVAEVEHLLNRACRGREWGQILPPTEPTASSEGVGRLSALAFEAMRRAPSLPSDVYVGGTGHMAAVWDNLTTVHRVLEVLEREAEILSLLAHAPGTTIRIGEELGVADGTDMAVVSTTYEAPGGDGSIGVIGPMRMDYKTAISAVERIGRELGDRIGT
jgi:heat-inducible transcriptional repressor